MSVVDDFKMTLHQFPQYFLSWNAVQTSLSKIEMYKRLFLKMKCINSHKLLFLKLNLIVSNAVKLKMAATIKYLSPQLCGQLQFRPTETGTECEKKSAKNAATGVRWTNQQSAAGLEEATGLFPVIFKVFSSHWVFLLIHGKVYYFIYVIISWVWSFNPGLVWQMHPAAEGPEAVLILIFDSLQNNGWNGRFTSQETHWETA